MNQMIGSLTQCSVGTRQRSYASGGPTVDVMAGRFFQQRYAHFKVSDLSRGAGPSPLGQKALPSHAQSLNIQSANRECEKIGLD